MMLIENGSCFWFCFIDWWNFKLAVTLVPKIIVKNMG